ncbi:hypothetical protein DB345_06085 [Spartobacteria bacterium LR76]|nr:hypothetical protein DB345_06085 [Spartobacteria bacterium LR76]
MINSLHLKNFKCFPDKNFTFNSLNVLCGQNGFGKSSVLQSLLLWQITQGKFPEDKSIPLNGPHGLELGTVADIFSQNGEGKTIEITTSHAPNKESRVVFDASSDYLEDRFLSIYTIDSNLESPIKSTFPAFTYLSAERQGPRDTQQIQSKPITEISLGPHGEFAAEILARFERSAVREEICHPTSKPENRLLLSQAESWMSEWVNGIQIKSTLFPDTNIAAIRIRRKEIESEWMKPTNFGFGISYSLPIVLGALLSERNGIFLIDSPESHLHPKGQVAMGEFLAVLASTGVQVFIETHSDHVVNGIRLAAKRNKIDASNVAIHFFESFPSQESNYPKNNPRLLQNGKLTSWPDGFFDQWEIALHELF